MPRSFFLPYSSDVPPSSLHGRAFRNLAHVTSSSSGEPATSPQGQLLPTGRNKTREYDRYPLSLRNLLVGVHTWVVCFGWCWRILIHTGLLLFSSQRYLVPLGRSPGPSYVRGVTFVCFATSSLFLRSGCILEEYGFVGFDSWNWQQ